MLTLEDYAETVITPMLLSMFGLPDTDAGREILDVLVAASLAAPDEGWDD